MNDKKSCASTSINWYPGHMAKTKKQIIEDLKLIDVVVIILDARIPRASQNPDLQEWTKEKKKIMVLNKSDLAEEKKNQEWIEYYRKQGIPFIRVSNLFIDRITEPEICLDMNDIKGLENYFLKKDTILFSKDGSVGIAYKVEQDTKAITSSAILHLEIKNTKVILPEYLTLVLNSDIVKLQAERDSNGAIIQHWKPSEIDNVIIPILNRIIEVYGNERLKTEGDEYEIKATKYVQDNNAISEVEKVFNPLTKWF